MSSTLRQILRPEQHTWWISVCPKTGACLQTGLVEPNRSLEGHIDLFETFTDATEYAQRLVELQHRMDAAIVDEVLFVNHPIDESLRKLIVIEEEEEDLPN